MRATYTVVQAMGKVFEFSSEQHYPQVPPFIDILKKFVE